MHQPSTREQHQMIDLIEQSRISGLSKKEFCMQQGLPEWKYYYWQKRYHEERQPIGFVPLKIDMPGK